MGDKLIADAHAPRRMTDQVAQRVRHLISGIQLISGIEYRISLKWSQSLFHKPVLEFPFHKVGPTFIYHFHLTF